jgi:hypothetical protein
MKKETKTISWLATFFAMTGIHSVAEVDYGLHHNKINQCVTVANPKGMEILGDLIQKARKSGGSAVFEFKHVGGDSDCLCSMCRGEEGQVLLGMYRHYGYDIVIGEKTITIRLNGTFVRLLSIK